MMRFPRSCRVKANLVVGSGSSLPPGVCMTSPVREKPKTERNPEAWEAIGIEPCGPLEFIRTWESIYRDRLDDELLSVTMERAIQRCRGRRIPVVRKVFEAKRAVERREADEIATYAANAIPELEAEPWAR